MYGVGTTRNVYKFFGGSFRNNTAAQAGGALHLQSINFHTNALVLDGVEFAGESL